jgi:DNA-binding PadR family transcriptional regulator
MKTSLITAAMLLPILLVFSVTSIIDIGTVQSVSGFSIVCVFIMEHASSEIDESLKLSDNVQDGVVESEDVLSTRKRILKAVLAPAILAQLGKRNVLSATNIIDILQKSYNIKLSAGTVYPVLDALETDGKIKRLPRRIKKLYVLTSKGKENIKNLQENMGDLQKMLNELLG